MPSSTGDHWFDALAKSLAMPATRRGALTRLGAGLLAAAGASLFPRRAQAYGLSQCTAGSGTAQCPPGTTCIAGLCLQPYQSSYCPPGFSYCGSQCINTQGDPNHCGGCNVQCPYGVECTFGACTIVETPASVCQGGSSQSIAGTNGRLTISEAGVTISAVASGGSGQMTLAGCGGNPASSAPPAGVTTFFDLNVTQGSSFGSLTLTLCSTTNSTVYWNSPANGWLPVNPPASIDRATARR